MNQTTYLKGDVNNNGKIDNDKEERANIEYNAKDIKDIQNEINRMKKRINVGVVNISNKQNEFASSAKLAEELTDGKQRVFFNNMNKSVVFKNGLKPLTACVQIGTNENSINNINVIRMNECQPIKSFVQTYSGLSEEQQSQSIPSVKVINDLIENLSRLHTHKTDDISRDITTLNEEEEELIETVGLNEILDNKADLIHTHTTADLTNWATATENFARTNTSNTFTSAQTINGTLTTTGDITANGVNINTTLTNKADSSHTHKTNDVSRDFITTIINANEEEEEITETVSLNDILDGKSDITHNHDISYAAIVHNHDERYALLTNIVSEIHNYVNNEEENEEETINETLLIPNVQAIKAYCANFLTPTSIINNTQLQNLLKGDDGLSAFDVWKAQQPPKQQGESDYTINDYLNAIKGATGATGATGPDGLSAFEIWKAKQKPKDPDYTEDDFLKALQPEDSVGKELVSYGLTAASFVSSIFGDYSLQTQLTALQTQIGIMEGQVATILGGESAEAFVDAMGEAKDMVFSLSQYWGTIKTRCTTAVSRIRNIGSSMRATLGGYSHIVPV